MQVLGTPLPTSSGQPLTGITESQLHIETVAEVFSEEAENAAPAPLAHAGLRVRVDRGIRCSPAPSGGAARRRHPRGRHASGRRHASRHRPLGWHSGWGSTDSVATCLKGFREEEHGQSRT